MVISSFLTGSKSRPQASFSDYPRNGFIRLFVRERREHSRSQSEHSDLGKTLAACARGMVPKAQCRVRRRAFTDYVYSYSGVQPSIP
jgi:hypothetical protein